MKTVLKTVLLVVLVFLGIGLLGVYWTFYRTLPDYDATVAIQGLREEVQVHWDDYGIPHIYADNRHDLYYALGYVHAQDRLWQMTLTQMAAEGRLAEFLGEELIPADRFQRTIGFWKTARQIEAQLADSTRGILEAYASGVNAYTARNRKGLPLEFSLVEMRPIEWTVTHSLALARLMAWELNIAWKSELTLAYLGQQLDPRYFQELLPDNPMLSRVSDSDRLPKIPEEQLLGLLEGDREVRRLLGYKGFGVGSNAWAIDASRSAAGAPLLAGDPHLGLHMPGKWYEVHLNLNGKNLAGATLAGAPIVILGQNDFLAWSLTNVMTDDSDFFVEKVNPDDPGQYLVDSLAGRAIYEDFRRERSLIKVRNRKDTTFTRRLTGHGPVISDIHPDSTAVDDRVVTMKWTAHQVSHEVDALLGINWSQSFEEFQSHLPRFKVPGQNIVYADRSGNIALYTLGSVPLRSGNPVLFREGWKPEQDWQGYLPFDRLPKIVNPESGWVANANNPVEPGGSAYISIYWEPRSRYDRIRQYLSQNDRISTGIFQVMQIDTYSHYARRMIEIILPVLKNAPENFNTVNSYLENWEFRYEPSETAASIMDTFILKLAENTLKDELGQNAYRNFLRFSGLPARTLLRFMIEDSFYFDDRTTDVRESRADMIIRSMNETVSFLESEVGIEPFEWRWENLHTITLKPQLFGEAAERPDAGASLRLIVNNLLNKGPYPAKGHKMSINNGEYLWSDPYQMVLGPSIRRIVDLSDLSTTLSITPTGQSGNALSQYYGDQTESWLNGEYKFLYQDSTLFDETVYRTMRLVPTRAD